MKYLLFFLLLVTVLITAGCVGGDQNSAVTPSQKPLTPTITSTSTTIPPSPSTIIPPVITPNPPQPTKTKVYHGASRNSYEPCGDAALNVRKCMDGIIYDKEYCDYWYRRYPIVCENAPHIEDGAWVITPTPTP